MADEFGLGRCASCRMVLLHDEPLCGDCESAYRQYVANYKPRPSRDQYGKIRRDRMTKPQSRHQWAAHRRARGEG